MKNKAQDMTPEKEEALKKKKALIRECIKLEKEGGDVVGLLRQNGYVSGHATWMRWQRDILGREPSKIQNGYPTQSWLDAHPGEYGRQPSDQPESGNRWKVVKPAKPADKAPAKLTPKTAKKPPVRQDEPAVDDQAAAPVRRRGRPHKPADSDNGAMHVQMVRVSGRYGTYTVTDHDVAFYDDDAEVTISHTHAEWRNIAEELQRVTQI